MSIIYKDAENKVKIKTSVRLNKFNQLELFYYDEQNEITCFSYAEGHESAVPLEYMYSCKPVDKDTAEAFILAYNMRFDDEVLHVYSKRLTKGF